MDFHTFVNRVIDDGIEAAKADYTEKKDQPKLKGSIEGFNACRGKNSIELGELLNQANQSAQELVGTDNINKYWELSSFAAEVGWVCNVASAALFNQRMPIIVTPTARGLIKAAEIMGVGSFSLN